MDDVRRVAVYARVSSQHQAEEATIQSQVAALEHRVSSDGGHLEAEMRFLDEGYSGATLRRPALERLRDLIHAGGVERLYVHSPDRLARNFLKQAVLLDEFARQQVEVVFLNCPRTEATPESNLLLQMQGMIAEYEREKILERTRRGRRFSARQGRVSVLGHAPCGYRYVNKHDGQGEARYDLVLEEARLVRDMFRWVGLEGLSLAAVVRRLAEQRVPTRTGLPRWDAATVRGILLNPAYYGVAHWGKTRLEDRPASYRPSRGQPEVPRRNKVARATAIDEQECIAVPALISKDLFDAVGQRLAENRRRQRERRSGATYLLSGLLVCTHCGSAYCARRSRRKTGHYVYYRCLGSDRYRHGGAVLCSNQAVSDYLEDEIWADVCELLQNPDRLRAELNRRQKPVPAPMAERELQSSIARLKRQLARILEMYENGYLEKEDFATRVQRVKARLLREEEAWNEQMRAGKLANDHATLLADFTTFANHLKKGLKFVDFKTKRKILGLLIKRIEVGTDQVQIVYKVHPRPFADSPGGDDLQHRLKLHSKAQGAFSTLGFNSKTIYPEGVG
jgi:site-specific DNA recombinase